MGGRIHRLDRVGGWVQEETHHSIGQEYEDQGDWPTVGRDAASHEQDEGEKERDHECREAQIDSPRSPGGWDRWHGCEYCANAAQSRKSHDADVEEPGIAPLNIHPERHYRRNQAEVEDREHHLPALGETDEEEERGHAGIKDWHTKTIEEDHARSLRLFTHTR